MIWCGVIDILLSSLSLAHQLRQLGDVTEGGSGTATLSDPNLPQLLASRLAQPDF